jgi:lantibiotic modifying enzyme
MYKPRGLAMEAAFAGLVAWLRPRCPVPLHAARVIDRGGYGWMERVETRPCAGRDAGERLLEGAGALLCIMYALAGEDLHPENLVVRGDAVVPIDLEVLFHPLVPHEGIGDRGFLEGWGELRRTVAATGLLPRLHTGPDGRTSVRGGLSVVTAAAAAAGVPGGEHGQRVAAGFRAMYRVLVRHRRELLSPGGPLRAFHGHPVRVLLRPTSVYASLLRRGASASFLRDGADLSIELDILKRPALRLAAPHRLWRAFAAEQRALEAMDIPIFHVLSTGTVLELGDGERLEGFAERSGAERVGATLRGLGSADLAKQL